MTRIAFLGTGAMGSRMAANLIRAGHHLTVWNRTAGALAPLLALGARQADTPREAASGADVVISMLTDDAAAHAVWLDPDTGAASGMMAGAIALESSTVSPIWVRHLAAVLARSGVDLLDAPVAGSRPQAESGQLIFMVGGDDATLERARPVLEAMGQMIHHIGPVGQGAVLKLAVNAFFAAQLASMAELLALLGRSGLPEPQAAELLATFPVTSPALAGAARMMAARASVPLFTIDLIAKDLGYALDEGEAKGLPLTATAATRNIFAMAQARGFGALNITALPKLFD
jgi:3-hydroxyisobutyrate dehydrogenase-like beta-hydroxyacid dehydrogenase